MAKLTNWTKLPKFSPRPVQSGAMNLEELLQAVPGIFDVFSSHFSMGANPWFLVHTIKFKVQTGAVQNSSWPAQNSTEFNSTQFISECISNAACHFFLGASGDVKIVDWKEPAFRVAVQTGFQGEAVRRIDDKKRFFCYFLVGRKNRFFFNLDEFFTVRFLPSIAAPKAPPEIYLTFSLFFS